MTLGALEVAHSSKFVFVFEFKEFPEIISPVIPRTGNKFVRLSACRSSLVSGRNRGITETSRNFLLPNRKMTRHLRYCIYKQYRVPQDVVFLISKELFKKKDYSCFKVQSSFKYYNAAIVELEAHLRWYSIRQTQSLRGARYTTIDREFVNGEHWKRENMAPGYGWMRIQKNKWICKYI